MAGEGACFLHAPPGFAPRPAVTGWYAEFDDLAAAPGATGYAPDWQAFSGQHLRPLRAVPFQCGASDAAGWNGLTTPAIGQHIAQLQAQFVAGDALPGLTLLNPPDGNPQARFLAFKGGEAPDIHAALEARGAITDVRGDVLRVGFGLYHDAGDVEKLLSVLNDIGRSKI